MGVIFVWTQIVDIVNAINKKLKVPGKHLFPPPPSCLPVQTKSPAPSGLFVIYNQQKNLQNLYR